MMENTWHECISTENNKPYLWWLTPKHASEISVSIQLERGKYFIMGTDRDVAPSFDTLEQAKANYILIFGD